MMKIGDKVLTPYGNGFVTEYSPPDAGLLRAVVSVLLDGHDDTEHYWENEVELIDRESERVKVINVVAA